MTCLGVFNLKFFYDGQPLEGTFIVSTSLSGPPILGMNIMSKYGLTLDPASRTISVPSRVAPLSRPTGDSEWLVSVAEATHVPPGQAARVRCRLLDPLSLKPLLLSREFVADADGLCAAIRSSPCLLYTSDAADE